MSKTQSNPTPTLPLSGEGADEQQPKAVSSLSDEGTSTKKLDMALSAPPPEKGEAGRGLKPRLHNLKHQLNHRRQLRKNQTEPEKQFWSWVRGKQLGAKFRRQQGIGAYIVDFYCAELGLIIEIDGDSHYTEDAKKYDDERTDFLQSRGFKVLRFTNQEIMKNKEGVLVVVLSYLGDSDE